MNTIDLLTLDRNLRKRGLVLGCAVLGLPARGELDEASLRELADRLHRQRDRFSARFAIKASRG
jgi:hypothetical protein